MAAAGERVGLVEWDRFQPWFRRRYQQGDGVTIIGGPGAGKTHLAIMIAEMRDYSFFVATKPNDPLVSMLSSRGWHVDTELEPMAQLFELRDREGRPVLDEQGRPRMEPIYPRYVYWPQPVPGFRMSLSEQADRMSALVDRALAWVQWYGSYALVLDETNYLTSTLRLRHSLDQLWHTSRTQRLSVVANAQRPSWIPRAALENVGHFFLFSASDREELRRLGEITGGLDWRPVAEEISRLSWPRHEVLYVGTRDRAMVRTVAPPWQAQTG